MDYVSTLETLEGLSNALPRRCTRKVVPSAILYALVKVRESQNYSW